MVKQNGLVVPLCSVCVTYSKISVPRAGLKRHVKHGAKQLYLKDLEQNVQTILSVDHF